MTRADFVRSRCRVLMGRKSLLAVLLCACGPAVGTDDDGGGSGGSSDGSTGGSSGPGITVSSTSTPSDSSGIDPSGATSSTGNDDVDDTSDDGPVCILHHHEVATPGECEHDTECCPGNKCVPSPNYSECVPLDDTPAAVGDPCVRTGVSDDCVAGAVCRGADPETNEGRCVELCTFSHGCDDPSTVCSESPLDLCLPPCDPLADASCAGTDICLPMTYAETFACVPDELPNDPGTVGVPCPASNDVFAGCDVGHMCVRDEHVAIASCLADDESGCCTAICAMDDPLACAGIGAETCLPISALIEQPWPDALGVGYCG